MSEEWATPPQLEEMALSQPIGDNGGQASEAGAATPAEAPPPVLDEQMLLSLEQPLAPRTNGDEQMAVSFAALQDCLRLLAHHPVHSDGLREQVRMLDQDRRHVETALEAKRPGQARGLLDNAWLRLAQILPDDRLALLLRRRIHYSHPGTGTQTMVGWFDSLREEAAQLVQQHPDRRDALRGYVLILEEAGPAIEAGLSAGKFDHAWLILRGLWERRLGVLPAGQLGAECRALELQIASVGRGKRLDALRLGLKEAAVKAASADPRTVEECRSLLTWVKREVNESAQSRYWRYNIYERRVKRTAWLLALFLAGLALVSIVLRGVADGLWASHITLTVGVLLAGALGGAVSGLRSSDEISQARLSSAYFKQAVALLRMLVGAAASFVFYLLLDSGLVAIALDPAVSSVVYLALGFVAGFSEQFFLQTLNQVGGGGTPPPGSQEPPGEGADPLDAEPGR